MVPQKASIFKLITDSPEKHQLIFCKASPRLYENQTVISVDDLSAIVWAVKSGKVVYCHPQCLASVGSL